MKLIPACCDAAELQAARPALAVSFFTMANARLARGLVDILREANQPVPPELAALMHSGGGGGGGGGFRSRGYYRGSQSESSGANTAPLGSASPW